MKFIPVGLLLFWFFITSAVPGKELPLVWVVSTGGTIAERINPATGAAVPSVSGPHGYLRKMGAVLGGQIDTYKARLLLMLALAQKDFSIEKLKRCFQY